jgi:hypothetical protein
MIHVRLAGGLGNQLFQLAAATLVDPTGHSRIVVHTGALGRYVAKRQPDSLRLMGSSEFSVSPDNTLIANCLRWFVVTGRAGKWIPGLSLSDQDFERGLITKRKAIILDGYYQQGWNDSRMVQATQRMRVRPPAPEAAARVSSEECVIHIRGGDFLRLPQYQVATPSYYHSAIEQARAAGYTRFAVITDDPPYALQICGQLAGTLPQGAVRVVTPADDALCDFDTLRSASARIIGNSTFAWWATALDTKKAQTWSPSQFILAETRDYFLPWESLRRTE